MAVPVPERGAEAAQAKAALDVLVRALGVNQTVRLTAAGRRSVEVPALVLDMLIQILGHVAQGSAVAVVPLHAELTTQQAADMLNVSRPYLVRLLDAGKIPFHRAGTHRRVRVGDLLAYKADRDARSRDAVRDLTEMAQKDGLGY